MGSQFSEFRVKNSGRPLHSPCFGVFDGWRGVVVYWLAVKELHEGYYNWEPYEFVCTYLFIPILAT